MAQYFVAGPFEPVGLEPAFEAAKARDASLRRTGSPSTSMPTRSPGYGIATISLKPIGGIPGDASSDQMDLVADLADRYSLGEIRVSHLQNLDSAACEARRHAGAVTQACAAAGLATANEGLITDIIACPGLDYCSLANARAIPIAQQPLGALRHDASARPRSAICRSRSPAASMPAAITMSPRSASSASTARASRTTRSRSAARPARTARSASWSARALAPTASSTRWRRWSTPISACACRAQETFLEAVRRVGLPPFKEALYGQRQCVIPATRPSPSLGRRRPRRSRRRIARGAAPTRSPRDITAPMPRRCCSLALALYGGRIALVSSFGAEFGRAAAHGRRDRPVDPGDLPRHRAAVRPDHALPQRPRPPARPDRCAHGKARMPSVSSRRIRTGCCPIAIPTSAAGSARSSRSTRRWRRSRPGSPAASAPGLDQRPSSAPFEAEAGRIKVNPLANWSSRDVTDYLDRHGLPPHPLVADGYPSIGCMPCTSRVKAGEDARAGRWRGKRQGRVRHPQAGDRKVGQRDLRAMAAVDG